MQVSSILLSDSERIKELERQIGDIQFQMQAIRTSLSKRNRAARTKRVNPDLVINLSAYTELASPVTINNAGGSSVSWTTFNAFPYIPEDAAFVCVDARGTSGGAGELRFRLRRLSGQTEYEVASCYGATAKCSGVITVLPVVKSANGDGMLFDYDITAPALSTWTVRLLGYFKYSKALGEGWSQFLNPDGSGGGGSTGSGGSSGDAPPL